MMPAKSGPHGGIDEQKLSEASKLKPEGNKQKKWAKRYRTEIAASSASILSTFAAVSLALISQLAYADRK